MQKHIVKKASNYVGHNVLIKDGDVQMVNAKARIEAYKKNKELVKKNKMRRIDDYVSNILKDSLDVANIQRQSTIDEYGVEIEELNSESSQDQQEKEEEEANKSGEDVLQSTYQLLNKQTNLSL